MGFPSGTSGKESTCQCRICKRHWFHPWVGKIPPKEGIATHSSILAWRIPWTEEPGGLQSIGSQRVRHHWSDLAHKDPWIGKIPWRSGNPLQFSCLENLIDRGAWWATGHRVQRVEHSWAHIHTKIVHDWTLHTDQQFSSLHCFQPRSDHERRGANIVYNI